MQVRPLGRTGVQVSSFCLGAMMFGAWGNPDRDESISIIHAALDAGVNFIDTADVYGAGESEEIVGKALAGAGVMTSCWPMTSSTASTRSARRV
jgi:aryl-alcohol dehydrogenase-like predicted oxidoreductase